MSSNVQKAGLKRRRFFTLLGAGGFGAWIAGSLPFGAVRAFTGNRNARSVKRPVKVTINPQAVKRNRKGR